MGFGGLFITVTDKPYEATWGSTKQLYTPALDSEQRGAGSSAVTRFVARVLYIHPLLRIACVYVCRHDLDRSHAMNGKREKIVCVVSGWEIGA